MKKYLSCFLFLLLLFGILAEISSAGTAFPRQIRKAGARPDEIISMSSEMRFDAAVMLINELSKKYFDKFIIDQTGFSDSIGIDIDNMHWMDALEMILYANDMWYTETRDYILIYSKKAAEEKQANVPVDSSALMFNSREVIISAVFFESNDFNQREIGASFKLFHSYGDTSSITSSDGGSPLMEYKLRKSYDFGTLLSIFRAMEEKKIGDIISRPQVSVMSGKLGTVQIGSDYSITTQDFAGNAITSFFSTGTIVKVTPRTIFYDSLTFVSLDLEVEKSSAVQGAGGSQEIKKTSAKTTILLLDGEETVIGGLYSNEDSRDRKGVPFLKDLPWWFLGLRYIFGYEIKSIDKKELIILIKAELLPTLAERVKIRAVEIKAAQDYKTYIDQQRQESEEKMEKKE